MIHPIATRKITASLFAMAWLVFVGQGTSYSQPPIAEGKIYWTNRVKGIQRANLDGSQVEQLIESDVRRPAEIALDLLRGKIYWTDLWNIYCSDLDGSNLKDFNAGWEATGVTNIALDVFGGKIYWISDLPESDYPYGHVGRANLDGSNSEILHEWLLVGDIALDLVRGNVYYLDSGLAPDQIIRSDLSQSFDDFRIPPTPSLDYLGAMALDVDGGRAYWTNLSTKTILRADLNGENIEEILTVSDGYPEEIALDVDRGKVYWTNPATQTIQRADLDGSNVEILFNLEGDVLYTGYTGWGPRIGIALDVGRGKIYWADSRQGTIQRADLDGQNVEVLFDPIVKGPHGIALYLDKMYWSDMVKGTIQRADLDGSNVEILIAGLNRPKDIALLAEDKIYWTEETGRIRKYLGGSGTGKIQVADLDGSNVKEVLTDLSYLGDIALDVVRDKICWRESFLGELWEHTIQRADLDGSNVEAIIVSEPTGSPSSEKMALDVLAGKIYWMAEIELDEQDVQVIRRAELDGSNVETIVVNENWAWDYYGAFALDLIGKKIYWSARASDIPRHEGTYYWAKFFWSNLDGSNVEEIWGIPGGWGISPAPTDLALDISHPTSVSTPDTTPAIPATSGLSPNFPNPFNASTQIAYDIASPGLVRLKIYNTLGQPVHTLVDQFQTAGSYQVRWDVRDQQGTALAAGVYLVRLHYPGGEQTRRLLLLK